MPQTPRRPHTKWLVAFVVGALGSTVLAIVILAFLWPSKTSDIHNLPVSISGPEASVSALETALDKNTPGMFDLVAADDRDQVIEQVKTRQTYGGIVLTAAPQPPEVLTAPAASGVASQLLTGVAAQLPARLVQQVAGGGGDASAVKVEVTAIVPLSETDSTGVGLASASFPLAIGGTIGGVLISLLVVGAMRRMLAAVGFATFSGIVLALIMQPWFGYLQGDFWINALAMGLMMLATAMFTIGFASLLGRAGIAIGGIVTVFLGNPLSAAAAPWQFLAEPWGAIGQYLVPGASNYLIRSLSYFPDADNSQRWWTLSGWVALGTILAVVGHFRDQPAIKVPESTLEEASVNAAAVPA